MKAVIMAAGRGKRLKWHTEHKPKPLVHVLGNPILEHTFASLPDVVDKVVLVVGYFGEQIMGHFGKEFNGREIKYRWQKIQLGTFNALAIARKELSDPFLVLSGDDIYDKKDVEKLLRYERAILVSEVEDATRFGACLVKGVPERLKLVGIDEKPKECGRRLVNIGVYKLTTDIFGERIVIGTSGESLLSVMIGNLAERMDIFIERAEFWAPIACPEDIEMAEMKLRQRKEFYYE
jgi:bifunctional UDP-N-acetylglucosamine pyrophosphorylase/glucosamine-1-phosphate N-acetyltransferase